ncbi:hypothetical protein TNCV_356851 [Trichonephila clavipes]|nr:hypothetical protein TNCV_356851 [Trichonephila clavipes]
MFSWRNSGCSEIRDKIFSPYFTLYAGATGDEFISVDDSIRSHSAGPPLAVLPLRTKTENPRPRQGSWQKLQQTVGCVM